MLFVVASLTLISSDVVNFMLIIETRYLNFGTRSNRTGPIPFRVITFH